MWIIWLEYLYNLNLHLFSFLEDQETGPGSRNFCPKILFLCSWQSKLLFLLFETWHMKLFFNCVSGAWFWALKLVLRTPGRLKRIFWMLKNVFYCQRFHHVNFIFFWLHNFAIVEQLVIYTLAILLNLKMLCQNAKMPKRVTFQYWTFSGGMPTAELHHQSKWFFLHIGQMV